MLRITVVGGEGSITVNFGTASFEGVSLLSPDNTPMYDFHIHDADDHLAIAATGIDSQMTVIKENFKLIGFCTLHIANAADDGEYSVKLVSR